MAPAQLSRLRPQIIALSSLFEQPHQYIKALVALLEKYRSEVDISTAGIKPHSLIRKLNIPQILTEQLGISFNHLCNQYPEEAIQIAKSIWDLDYFEYKQISLLLLSNLPNDFQDNFFSHILHDVTHESPSPIFSIILEIMEQDLDQENANNWLVIINSWLESEHLYLRKQGVRTLSKFLKARNQFLPPQISSSLSQIFSNPTISMQGELIELVKILSAISLNEAAALLISLGVQNPHKDTRVFLRKCAFLFPENIAKTIRETSHI